MTAIDKGQQEQQGSSKKPIGASPAIDELIAAKGLRKAGGDSIPVPKESSGDEAELNAQESDQSNVVRWLQLLAAVGIPLLLAYLVFAGLVNPQFAELRELIGSNRELISSNRELISSNREAIAANASSIERLEDKIDGSVARLEDRIDGSVARLENRIDGSVARLEDRIDLIAEVLILATTNENITEAELRNLLNAGEE